MPWCVHDTLCSSRSSPEEHHPSSRFFDVHHLLYTAGLPYNRFKRSGEAEAGRV